MLHNVIIIESSVVVIDILFYIFVSILILSCAYLQPG